MTAADLCAISDEFGPLERILLPGQRVEDLTLIIAAVTEELQPSSFIERMLARDYALQIVFGEYLRMAKKLLLDELIARVPGGEGAPASTPMAVLGKAITDNLSTIATLSALEIGVCAERDRIAKLFDERRLAALNRALAMLEGQPADVDAPMPAITEREAAA